MEKLSIIPDLDTQGFRDEAYGVTEYEGELIIGGLAQGTGRGKPMVQIGLEDPETGGFLVAQTTLALFLTAADVLKTTYGDPRQ